jgi:hypothetical protein
MAGRAERFFIIYKRLKYKSQSIIELMNYCQSCDIHVSERQLQRDLSCFGEIINDKTEFLEIITEANNKKRYKISERH